MTRPICSPMQPCHGNGSNSVDLGENAGCSVFCRMKALAWRWFRETRNLESSGMNSRTLKQVAPSEQARRISRLDDRRVLIRIFWDLAPRCCGAICRLWSPTACSNRFVRRPQAGVSDRIIDALAGGHDAAAQMIDTSVVRVHQHGSGLKCLSACNALSPLNQDRTSKRGDRLSHRVHGGPVPSAPVDRASEAAADSEVL